VELTRNVKGRRLLPNRKRFFPYLLFAFAFDGERVNEMNKFLSSDLFGRSVEQSGSPFQFSSFILPLFLLPGTFDIPRTDGRNRPDLPALDRSVFFGNFLLLIPPPPPPRTD